MDVPVKTLWGQGEKSIHRRYETPQMHVSLTLFRDHPIEPKRPLSMESERSSDQVISEGYPSIPSDEHMTRGLIWVLLDVLYELDDCTSHQVGFVNVIFVTNGGHFVLEGQRHS